MIDKCPICGAIITCVVISSYYNVRLGGVNLCVEDEGDLADAETSSVLCANDHDRDEMHDYIENMKQEQSK